jgi:hypothetical protein
MDKDRRTVLGAGVMTVAATLLPATATAMAKPTLFDPVPPLPTRPTPGKPGDFAFLTGEWRIHNNSIVNGAWLEYEGEATVHAILGGIGSVEELRIPARNFSGMGLRLLDVEKKAWSDFWVNAKSGVLTTPGQAGSFENGIGIFSSEYEDNGRKMISVGLWDRITPVSCRWRQAASADGGRTWEHNWLMDWRRVR